MIIKERNAAEHRDGDECGRAGAHAEEQMAHYLRRAFADTPDVLVLNDIRIEVEDETKEVAQFDHLIVHRHGLIIVESKSVTGRVIVNKQGEWIRTWSGGSRGMALPVLQAKRQGDLLRKALIANKASILGKYMFGKLQKGFRNCPIEILVAISDKGIIERQFDVSELHKADQIPGCIQEILERHRKAGRLIGGSLSLKNYDGIMDFSEEERRRIADFLLEHHYPTVDSPAPPEPTPAASRVCPNCGQPLVLRMARKGKNPGESFWGCAAFPKCRHIEKLVAK